MNFLNWLVLTSFLLIVGTLLFKMYYYKNLYEKESEYKKILKATLEEAEILIKKYQIQLQRSLGNLDILNDEMNKLKNDIKAVKARNSQYKIENEQLKRKIKELENKIEALL
jgi:peptidoglycan hydrolase CwlO-like protein